MHVDSTMTLTVPLINSLELLRGFRSLQDRDGDL
jgi:hypothetical protein